MKIQNNKQTVINFAQNIQPKNTNYTEKCLPELVYCSMLNYKPDVSVVKLFGAHFSNIIYSSGWVDD